MNKRPSQCDRVYKYMQTYGSISQWDAWFDLGVMRLASRISELRKQGIAIVKKSTTVKNRFGENSSIAVYSLAQ